jgi:hypothetical protein
VNLIADLETEISVTLSAAQKSTALHTWAHTAWYNACEYILANHSTKITKDSVAADGTLGSGNDAYWGLDHIKTDLRTKIKTNTSLFAYYGIIPKDSTKDKFFVVTDGSIYRFETTQANQYFNAAKSGLISYTAARYYNSIGDSTNETASTNGAISNVSTFVGNIN